MTQKFNNTGVLEKMGKTLHIFAGFIISPWVNENLFNKMQKRIEILERKLESESSQAELSQERMIYSLQKQLDLLEESTNNRLEKILNYELRHQVLEVIQGQIDFITRIIKPTLEVLLRE